MSYISRLTDARLVLGKHERRGRHEAPTPIGFFEFGSHVTDAERERFKRLWQSKYASHVESRWKT